MPLVMDEKRYGQLLAEHLPAVIETDEEQDRLAEALMNPSIPPRVLTPEEKQLAALLGHLIDDYERRTSAKSAKRYSPVQRLKYLMSEHGLKQADLADIFGGQPVVSAVLAGKRSINLQHARKLSARFGLSIDAFLSA